MIYVTSLDGGQALSEAGNKAASLGRVWQLVDIRVPAGFGLSFRALEDSLEQAGLRQDFETLLDVAEKGGAPGAATTAGRLRELIMRVPFCAAFDAEVAETLVPFATRNAVSVRSSSNLEDAGSLSFAGQHDSLLNISGEADLRRSISEVWASGYTDRAVAYLLTIGRSLAELRMGVVVQEMVAARAAGVAFTIHPLTGASDVLHISAAPGLGEATVSGEVAPDEVVLERDGLKPGERVTQDELPVLDDAEAAAVATAALAIEAQAGGNPMDVEFALDSSGLWILQARPMVVAAESAVGQAGEPDWRSPVPGANWQRNWRLGEWLPHAITPLFGAWILPRLVASREEFGTGALGWEDMETFSMPRPWFVLVNGYFYTRTDYPGFGGGGQSLTERLARMKKSTAKLEAWRERDLPAYIGLHEQRRELDLESMSDAELLGYVDQLVAEAGEFWSFIAPIGYGFEEMVFKPIYDRLFADPDKPHHAVLFGGYPSRMTDANAELHALAGRVAANEAAREALALGANDTAGLSDWLQQAVRLHDAAYGHQVLSLDTWWPTLGETPAHTLASLRVLVANDVPDPRKQLAAAADAREAAVSALYAELADDAEKLAGFRTTIEMYQGNAAVREDCNFYLQAGWPHIRRALTLLGNRLVGRGVLERMDQIHFLDHDELRNAVAGSDAELGRVADGRFRTWERQRELSAPMRIGDKPASAPGTWDEATGTLSGNGASPGRATGPAKILLTPEDGQRVERGDVVVLKAASPLFTPVLLIAGALVVEVGGGASHSSLVARELGLPAVVNATNATSLFSDGEQLAVDGIAGTVTRAS